MSSSSLPLKFSRPLAAVRSGGAARPHAGSADEVRTAELSRQLRLREEELGRFQEDLARREQELAAKASALDERMAELGALIGSLNDKKAEMLEANEEEIVSFSLSITQKVLQYEIENGRYKIGEVVRSTLRAVRDRGALVLRVNPRDYDLTRAAVDELGQTFGTTRITTVPDESIPLASCCIETDSGKIFSDIPGRLERIEKTLLKKNGDAHAV